MTPRVLLALGVVCLAAGAVLLGERLLFLGGSESAAGQVVSVGTTRYTIQFEHGGDIVDVSRPLPVGADERERLKVGQPVLLRFRPDSPQDARTFGLEFWFFPVGLLLVGALGVIAARYRRTVTSSDKPAAR